MNKFKSKSNANYGVWSHKKERGSKPGWLGCHRNFSIFREPYELVCLVWGIFFELRYLVDIFGFRSSLPLIWNWLGFNLICGDNWITADIVFAVLTYKSYDESVSFPSVLFTELFY